MTRKRAGSVTPAWHLFMPAMPQLFRPDKAESTRLLLLAYRLADEGHAFPDGRRAPRILRGAEGEPSSKDRNEAADLIWKVAYGETPTEWRTARSRGKLITEMRSRWLAMDYALRVRPHGNDNSEAAIIEVRNAWRLPATKNGSETVRAARTRWASRARDAIKEATAEVGYDRAVQVFREQTDYSRKALSGSK